jgi:DNA modification methylase
MAGDPKALTKAEFGRRRVYRTRRGAAYHGDALDLLPHVADSSVQAIVTSPPFALKTKKAYGNRPPGEYLEWFRTFTKEFDRVLREDGSLVIEIGGAWLPGTPTRSIYQFELLVMLVKECGFHLAEEFFWVNKAKIPGPAQWVNVERIRVKDAVTPIWWLSKSERPKANNRSVLTPYTKSHRDLMRRGYNEGPRPSGHVVGKNFAVDNGGAIPSNLIEIANTRWNDPYRAYCKEHGLDLHPARFPTEIPEFFVKFLTDPDDLVLDPFGGSNVIGSVAEQLGRKWLAFDLDRSYLEGSIGRFDGTKVTVS